ncbi:hypothetical protein KKE60_06505, partial [Patescibacteria group bacterium]|nr:hypothetical protein [Patescibacteria group bacterium]
VELTTPGVAPVVTPPDTMYMPEDAAIMLIIEADPLFVFFDTFADVSNISIILMYWIFYLGIALLLFLLAFKWTHSLLLAGAVLIGCFGFMTAKGLFPFWFILLSIMVWIAFLVMERRQQL